MVDVGWYDGRIWCGMVVFDMIWTVMVNLVKSGGYGMSNTAVKRLRMREFLSELSFELVQRLR